MFDLAVEVDAVKEDPKCGVPFSIMRDAVYRIKNFAVTEREAHIHKDGCKE